MSRNLTKLGSIVLLLAMSFGISAFAQKRADEPFRKIDPAIENQFIIQKQDNRSKAGEESASTPVRVIVHINDETNTNFNTVDGNDAPAIIAANVLDAQNAAIQEMTSAGIILQGRSEKSPFNVTMLLDYQYCVVGEVTDMKTLELIAAMDNVNWIEHDAENQLLTVEGRSLVGSNTVASQGHAGAGVGVAVIDSRFDLLHPELGGSTSLPNGVVRDGFDFVNNSAASVHSQSFSDCYHGTGTASIVRRYAPGADIYALNVFPSGSGASNSTIANAINWCITNRNGTNGGAPIRIISMSLGGGRNFSECNSGVIHSASGSALANNILVFAASGNDGWTNSMGSPACSSNVISVGSVWDENNANYSPFPPANCSDSNRQVNERTCYSDTASFLDIYAPSEEVICARCGTSGTFALGGTSSACPAAAGMTAQLLSHPNGGSYLGNKSSLVSLYQSTGVQVVGDTSKRRINLLAAVNSLGGGTPAPTASLSASPSTITSGGSATLTWSTTNATSVSINNGVGSVGTSGSVSVSPTSTTTYTITATGAGGTDTDTATVTVNTGGGGNQLADGVAESVSLATGATTTYTIDIPANASNLVVTLSGSGDLDLYVKNSPVNWPGDQGRHDTNTFKAPYIGGSAESVTFASPAAGTWHVLIHGYSGGSGSVVATWDVSTGGGGSWNYESFVRDTPHNYSNNRTYTFTYEKAGASQVAVHFNRLDTETNYDWVNVYDENNNRIYRVSGNLINSGSGSAFGRTDGWCVVQGSKIRVELVTDQSVRDWGYRTDQAAYFQ